MTVAATDPNPQPLGWTVSAPRILLALAITLAAANAMGIAPQWVLRPPAWLVLPMADWLNAGFAFLRDDLGLIYLTRAVADGVQWLLDVTANLLYGKRRWPNIGPIPWTMVAATFACLGYWLGGWRMAALAGGAFVWVAVMGQWKWTMETLSVILVAAPLSVLIGLAFGIWAWSSPRVERTLDPPLNLAQTLPHFAYMIPVVVFIGVGPKAGAIVTVIFATPPMIRMTLLGLKKVPGEVIEAGRMAGATSWQMLRHVRLPTARSDLLVGVNQVIMQSLAMVVLASFIGMPGLGQKLLQLLQALKIGRSIEIGITIVLIAIVLDRMTKAWATRQPEHHETTNWARQHPVLLIWLGLMAALWALSQFVPLAAEIGRRDALSLADPLDAGAEAVILFLDPFTEWLRGFLIINVLVPMRDALLWLPFSAVVALAAAAGWAVGGRSSALVCAGFTLFLAMSGWWDRSMITVYMVSFAVANALVIGLPLGIWAAQNDTRATRMLLVCDTAQTFPSFIYLIPVVMLFGVNDVAAIGAVVVFATIPIVRYTIEGLRGVPPTLIEAAEMSGASNRQILWNVRFPMALPTLAVGLNQTIMFGLFMVIIAAFIGTRDLGQEMQRALSQSDVGKGLVLGLCVAVMGLMADHLLQRWSDRKAKRLGLS
ncbi:MAG: ABC transporter permease subunit [Pseudomonadota bacterium]